MNRSWGTLMVLSLGACRPSPGGAGAFADDASSAPLLEVRGGGRPQVELTWRLFETQRWLEGHGGKRESAVIELLVNGGTPARVDLGRRDTAGCTVHDATGAVPASAPAGVLTSLDCSTAWAQVFRPNAAELRVVVADQVGAGPDGFPLPVTKTPLKTATVRIPADADIVVDHALARIPDEAPGL